MGKVIDLTDQRFGRLVVKEQVGFDKHKKARWRCECDCGNTKIIGSKCLRKGETKSCGCLKIEKFIERVTTHGLSGNATYLTWRNMLRRCNDSNAHDYKNYGGRGITVCDRWLNVENFFKDMGVKPKGLTIERVDNELGYFKGNCCWVTKSEQQKNKRIYKNNRTGAKGINWDNQRQKYRAAIKAHGKYIFLGRYETLTAAIKARKNGEQKYWE